MARITTRAGRVGDVSDRKSRTIPWCEQNGQLSGWVSDSDPGPIPTGASQRRQANVPVAITPE